MTNPFDLSYADGGNDLGFFKKIKKAFRKVEKKVNKARRKFNRKTMPKKVSRAIVKVEKNKTVRKVGKIAGAAAALYFGGPIVAKYAGAAMKSGAGAAIKSGAGKVVASSTIKKALYQGGKMAVVNRLQKEAQKSQTEAAKKVQATLQANQNKINEIAADPEFTQTYNSLVAQGKSMDDIYNLWKQSKTAQAQVTTDVAKLIQPILEQQYRRELPPPVAHRVASDQALTIADDEVKKVAGIDLKTVAAIGVPIAVALLARG